MKKSILKPKTSILSAEAMSLKTGRNIGHFAALNPKVTDLDDSVVIESAKQIFDNTVKPAAKASVKDTSSRGPRKPSKTTGKGFSQGKSVSVKEVPLDMDVSQALKEIGGILTVLTHKQRCAVMKKLNGAFGTMSKESGERKPKAKAVVPKAIIPKEGFNEAFSKTLLGSVLECTSKEMKKLAKSSSDKPSSELHEIHRYCLAEKIKAREKGVTPFPVDASFDAEDTTTKLINSIKVVSASFHKAGYKSTTPELIIRSGLCLIRGETPQELASEEGIIPSPDTWEDTPRSVPRTDEEAERRSAEILASKKQRKQRETKESDNQSPLSKRAKPNETPAQTPDSKNQASSSEAMEMEETAPDKTR